MFPKKIRKIRDRYPGKRFPKKALIPLIRKRVARDLTKTLRSWRITARERHKLLRLRAFEYEKMKYGGMIPRGKETLFRIVQIQKVDNALRSLLGKDTAMISHWLHTPNNGAIFRGKKAIVFMCEDEKNLPLVRQYLEYFSHGGW